MRNASLEGYEIAVPASIGNLGPGFDTLGLAVSLYLRVRITRVIRDGKGGVSCRFADSQPTGPNLVQRAFRTWRADGRCPSIEIDIRSSIPQRAGLGSSAAATVAGLLLRDRLDGPRGIDALAAAACSIEGHPDNAAAALFGGLTSSCAIGDGAVHVVRWKWPPAWRILVATPDLQLSTSASRGVLPRRVLLEDAVFNLQRLALLLGAVQQKDASLLAEAFDDRFHQAYRERLVPVLGHALKLKHPDLIGVCLSGAGPSVVAFAGRDTAGVERALRRLYRDAAVPCTIRNLGVHTGSPRVLHTRKLRQRGTR
jgi:homoserine kinase